MILLEDVNIAFRDSEPIAEQEGESCSQSSSKGRKVVELLMAERVISSIV
jgi:hypothetical protein